MKAFVDKIPPQGYFAVFETEKRFGFIVCIWYREAGHGESEDERALVRGS